MADKAYDISFSKDGDKAKVSELSLNVLRKLMDAADVYSITITSTARDAYDQARAMYHNIESYGVDAQKNLYAKPGKDVIDVYSQSKKDKRGKNAIIDDMKAKIVLIGPSKVSRHCADAGTLNVIDIAPSSIPAEKKKAFEDAIKAESGISRYFMPPPLGWRCFGNSAGGWPDTRAGRCAGCDFGNQRSRGGG
jgi:hypothetical protein